MVIRYYLLLPCKKYTHSHSALFYFLNCSSQSSVLKHECEDLDFTEDSSVYICFRLSVGQPEFPTSQNFYEGDVQVWRPYSRFLKGLGSD